MARRVFNHKRRILDFQAGRQKGLYPGMIVSFKYTADKITDKRPLVLVVWNDALDEKKIHGINFNYMSEYKIRMVIKKLLEGADPRANNILVEEDDQKAGDEDTEGKERKPDKNQLKEPYTRLKLPTFGEVRAGKMMSKTEASRQMKVLYTKVLKKLIKKEDMYRSYNYRKMKDVRVVRYDLEGLLGTA